MRGHGLVSPTLRCLSACLLGLAGEDYLNCAQAAIVASQVLAYRGQMASRPLTCLIATLYGILVYTLVNLRRLIRERVAEACLNVLMLSAMCLSIGARWPQIFLNFRNRGAGQLSISTTSLYLAGNCIRLYTTATQLACDPLTLLGSSCSALGNFILCCQIYFYR